MSSSLTIFRGIWPLKTWISRWLKPVEEEKTQGSTELKVYGEAQESSAFRDDESDAASATFQSIQETWVEVSTCTESQCNGRSPAAKSNPESILVRGHGQVKTGWHGAEDRNSGVLSRTVSSSSEDSIPHHGTHKPQLDELIPALERLRQMNHQVTQQIFEWNLTRAPLLKRVETVMRSLDGLMQGSPSSTHVSGLPHHLASRFVELGENISALRNGDFAAFQTEQSQYTATEDSIIQSLSRSGRLLDRLLEGDTRVSDVEETPDISQGPERIEIGEEVLERSAWTDRYFSQLDEVDEIRGKLIDLRSERARLLDEQESRTQFGLSMDDDSLQFLEATQDQDQVLYEEFEYATMVLDALERLLHDQEALMVPDDRSVNEEDEEAGLIEALKQLGLPEASKPSFTGQHGPRAFLSTLRTHDTKFAQHLNGTSTAPVDPANFINVWLLHRVCSMPRLLEQLTAPIKSEGVVRTPTSVEDLFVSTWFNDGSADDFAQYRTFADQQSKLVSVGGSQVLEQKSAAVPTRHPSSTPLLKMGPSTTSQDIITQAIRTRGSAAS